MERTSRITIVGLEHLRELEGADPKGFIIAFWHSNILLAPALRNQLSRQMRMLVSTHRDGEIIVNAVAGFGIEFIRGSAANQRKSDKEKGGASAIAQMIGAIEAGDAVGVTPDGPRGPARKPQAGVVRLAGMTGAPVLPFAWVASRSRTLKTWDGFQLALPFSSVYVVAKPAIRLGGVVSHDDVARGKRLIEEALNAALAEAELLAADGRAPAGATPAGAQAK
ncbi:MAG: DUF374 domain-containing protein [Alphaproteobacteria bacterium]|nr:DUF374 domain-containing protein [Alphaproteobacteria bacterium]